MIFINARKRQRGICFEHRTKKEKVKQIKPEKPFYRWCQLRTFHVSYLKYKIVIMNKPNLIFASVSSNIFSCLFPFLATFKLLRTVRVPNVLSEEDLGLVDFSTSCCTYELKC